MKHLLAFVLGLGSLGICAGIVYITILIDSHFPLVAPILLISMMSYMIGYAVLNAQSLDK